MAERFVQLGTAGEAEDVSHDRVFSQQFQRQLRRLGQRVTLRHDNATVPAIARHHHQIAELLERLGGDGEVNRPVSGHFGDLHR